MSSQAGKVEEQMEGETQKAVVEAQPPALDGRAACSAAVGGKGAADRIAGEKEQEDDLPNLPQIPTAWRNTFRQDGAGATALGAIEA
jgi:hypothetical protein